MESVWWDGVEGKLEHLAKYKNTWDCLDVAMDLLRIAEREYMVNASDENMVVNYRMNFYSRARWLNDAIDKLKWMTGQE